MNTALSTSTNSVPIRWVERLFEEMLLTYGKRFTDMWSSVDTEKMKRFWGERLSGLDREEMKRGFEAMKNKDWPPSLNEFINLCRPPVDPTAAYYEALCGLEKRGVGELGEWTHPAIFWAASPITRDLLTIPYKAIRERWELALEKQIKKEEWASIPEPYKALEAPRYEVVSKEEAKANIEKMKEMIGVAFYEKA